jgi:hypothetical protein
MLTIQTTSTVNITAGLNLLPIYSDIVMIATDYSTNVNNFLFQIIVNGMDYSDFSVSANGNYQGSINLSTVLDGIINADPSTDINQFINIGDVSSGAIKKINYIITSRDLNNTIINQIDNTSSQPLYVFNGVVPRDSPDVQKDPYYFFPNASNGHYLKKVNNDIYMQNPSTAEINDVHFLSFLDGSFGGSMPLVDVSSLNFAFYSGNSSTNTNYVFSKSTLPKIVTINLAKAPGITNTPYKMVVSNPQGLLPPVTVYFVDKNKIHDPYTILWTNQLGVQDSFLFNRVPQKDIAITSYTLGWYTKKIYNIDIDPVYYVMSDLMDDLNSKALEDLFYTPKAFALSKDWTSKQPIIIINDDTRTIYNKWNVDKILQHQISFAPSARQIVQKLS